MDVAAWAEAAGVLPHGALRGSAAAQEPERLRGFRETLRRGLMAWAVRGTYPRGLIALLNQHLARHAAAAGRRAARAPLWCRGPVSGGAARGRRSPPAPQVCEPELSADVLRRIESGAAPLVLYADVRGSGQIPRLLSAAPGGRPSWYRQPVDSRRSRRRNTVSGSRRQRRLDEGLACAFVRDTSGWAPTVWACPSGSACRHGAALGAADWWAGCRRALGPATARTASCPSRTRTWIT